MRNKREYLETNHGSLSEIVNHRNKQEMQSICALNMLVIKNRSVLG